MNDPIVSVVVLLTDFFHLANMTLQSICDQSETAYEIIVISTSKAKRDSVMLKPFSDKIKTIEYSEERDLAILMNKGVELSSGKYIHYLFSGDTYVSKYVMKYLNDLIQDKNYPDLISCSFLRRDEYSNPEAISFSFDYFKKGKIPMNIQSCWFLKSVLKELKYFNSKYRIQAGFDMICKIFLKKDKKVIFSNRVLTDYEFKKKPSKFFLKKAMENIKIIYHNFGFVKTVFWWMIHDHFRMVKLVMLTFKKAFFRP